MGYKVSLDSAASALTHGVVAYYQRGSEAPRLLTGTGLLEFARTQEIVLRHLPEPPAVIGL
ncbi:MAG: hypothetical protein MUF84_04495 [Anaerolineae bacterium]|nr:hypothetical protein [Anaerolineae bacterium]